MLERRRDSPNAGESHEWLFLPESTYNLVCKVRLDGVRMGDMNEVSCIDLEEMFTFEDCYYFKHKL